MDRNLRVAKALGITEQELAQRTDEFFAGTVATGPLRASEILTPNRNEKHMTEIQGRKLIMSFSRTKQVQQYEPMTVSATMEVDLPPGTTIDQARAVFTDEYAIIKGEVYRQMDLPFTWDENEKLIMETFEGSQVVAQAPSPAQFAAAPAAAPALAAVPDAGNPFSAPAPATPAPAAAPAPAAGGVPQVAEGAQTVNGKSLLPGQAAHWNAIVTELSSGGLKNYWDNRVDKRNPKGPDFKHKNKDLDIALWLNSVPADMAHLFQ